MSYNDEEEDKVLRIQLRSDCPCKSREELCYNDCCRPYHIGKKFPATAELLMRSRYSAYFFRMVDYLVETQHPDTREKNLKQELEDFVYDVNWVYLKIHSTSKGQEDDKKGKVEFTVKYFMDDELQEMTEHSRFRRFKGKWKYYDDKG